jgi:protein-tyrosine phosphatase
MIDAHRITSCLWQGANPPQGAALHAAGVNVLVLCAMEHQAPAHAYPGVDVIRAPMDDSSVVPQQIAMSAARLATTRCCRGQRVLIACNQGRNRSGLVSALVLWNLGYGTGKRCADRVRGRRPGALTNSAFYAWLAKLPKR